MGQRDVDVLGAHRPLSGALKNVAAAGNQHLARLSRELRASLNLGLPMEPYHDELLALSVEQHRALVEAVAAGAPDTAAEVARQHFTITTDALRRAAQRADEPELP